LKGFCPKSNAGDKEKELTNTLAGADCILLVMRVSNPRFRNEDIRLQAMQWRLPDAIVLGNKKGQHTLA